MWCSLPGLKPMRASTVSVVDNFNSDMANKSVTTLDKRLLACCVYLIYMAQREGIKITNKKLQKLLYVAQCYSIYQNKLGKYPDKRLLNQKFEAWVHGAVIPEVYRLYRDFGYNNIEEDLSQERVSRIEQELKDHMREILEEVWKKCGKLDASYLEAVNHRDKAWLSARGDAEENEISNNVISESEIREHAHELLSELRVGVA